MKYFKLSSIVINCQINQFYKWILWTIKLLFIECASGLLDVDLLIRSSARTVVLISASNAVDVWLQERLLLEETQLNAQLVIITLDDLHNNYIHIYPFNRTY